MTTGALVVAACIPAIGAAFGALFYLGMGLGARPGGEGR